MKLRFIAGAVCPTCSEMDTIQGQLENGSVVAARCAACGWESRNPQMPPAPEPVGQEKIPVRVLDPADLGQQETE